MNTDRDIEVSIVIPVYNEISIIEKTMDNLSQFKNYCEILFIDGGSYDGTYEMVKEQYNIIHSPKKGRANQMNYGAKMTYGDVIFFVHADSILPKEAVIKIQEAICDGQRVGCFKIKFDSKNILMKICGLMSNLRVVFRNIAFGDQGIFIERDYFNSIGGFKNIPLMEDYQISMDIKSGGEKIVLLKETIETSERRFLKNGRLKTMVKMQRLQYMYRRGKDIELISKSYR